jgi:hypothetical protein
MQIVTNEPFIAVRRKIGERAPFIGLLVLAAATVMLFVKPDWTWYVMILIWVGFVISIIGTYFGDRFVGTMAHHKKVPEALKGLDNTHTLLVYKSPIPFVLLGPGGVTTITVRSHGGKVTFADGRWKHREKMSFFRRLAGQEGLGSPDRMAEAEAQIIRNHLKGRVSGEVEAPVQPLVLFIDPQVQLDAEGSSVPVVRAADLKRWLRKDGRQTKLSDALLVQIATAFGVEP